jgi:murein DD-endopeptidase MepM/ murein hydrolase activator NlpD
MSQGTGAPLTRREALAREREAAAAQPVGAGPAAEAGPAAPPADRAPVDVAPAPAPRPARSPRTRTPRSRRGIAHRLLATGVLVFVGALVVGLSLPANALYNPGEAAEAAATAPHVLDGSGQSLTVDATGAPTTTESDYTASTKAQLLAQKYSGGVGGQGHGAVRWPFPYQVAILSPFGPRTPPPGCPECSPFHRGVDLAGGDGNPIFSIMDATVTERSGGSWTYGNYAILVGHYQGHEVKAIYEHMQDGSSPLQVGQQVKVGDFVGLVGETGEATAPHLHLELDVDGQLIDPIPWLEANAS